MGIFAGQHLANSINGLYAFIKHLYFYIMEDVQKEFSETARQHLAAARQQAIKMGYDHINSLHYLIADCEAGLPGSPFSALFESQDAYNLFIKNINKKKGWSFKPAPAALPLSLELENALRLSPAIKKRYNSEWIEPAHIYFAALQDSASYINQLLLHNEAIINRLYRHYRLLGIFKDSPPPAEDPVADKLQYEKILLEISNLSKSVSQTHSYAIVLYAAALNRRLPVVIGEKEATELAAELEKIKAERPMVHQLLHAVIGATRHHVKEVHINRLVNGLFHAKIIISNNNEDILIDSRPSDALTLATIAGVPIYTSKEIMEEAGIDP